MPGMSDKRNGSGFGKKPLALQVDPGEYQAKITRYEMVIARQKVSLGRMAELLDQRTTDVADHMRRANEAARWHADQIDDLTTSAMVAGHREALAEDLRSNYEGDLMELDKLVPADFDMYNEDDTRISKIAGYIKYLQSKLAGSQAKEKHWKAEFDKASEALDVANRSVSQAVGDARHNAKVANAAMRQQAIDIGDDDPPWQEGKQSFVQPASVERSPIAPPEFDPSASETIEWSGAGQLPPGEERPGNSF